MLSSTGKCFALGRGVPGLLQLWGSSYHLAWWNLDAVLAVQPSLRVAIQNNAWLSS